MASARWSARRTTLVLAAVVVALCLAVSGQQLRASAVPSGTELAPTIRAFMLARNSALLEPAAADRVNDTLRADPALARGTEAFVASEKAKRHTLRTTRSTLTSPAVRYIGTDAVVRVTAVDASGPRATVRFAVTDTFDLAVPAGQHTGQVVQRVAYFEKDGTQWNLARLAAGEDFSGTGRPLNEPPAP